MKENYLAGILLVLFVALISVFVLAVHKVEVFKKEHHCVNVGEEETTYNTQFIYDGKGNIQSTYVVPDTTYAYQCDDGKHRF